MYFYCTQAYRNIIILYLSAQSPKQTKQMQTKTPNKTKTNSVYTFQKCLKKHMPKFWILLSDTYLCDSAILASRFCAVFTIIWNTPVNRFWRWKNSDNFKMIEFINNSDIYCININYYFIIVKIVQQWILFSDQLFRNSICINTTIADLN